MIGEICAEINNYFTYKEDKHIDNFEIVGGVITPTITFITDYVRIIGSHLNDGVHKLSEYNFKDEKFHGAIWVMSPPDDFINLCKEIKNWQLKYGSYDSNALSPFNSESFGGYSYTKSNNTAGKSSVNGSSWQAAYANRLKKYRRLQGI